MWEAFLFSILTSPLMFLCKFQIFLNKTAWMPSLSLSNFMDAVSFWQSVLTSPAVFWKEEQEKVTVKAGSPKTGGR